MKLGVVFPQNETTADPGAIRDYAEAVEGAGYDHIVAYDHVLGASADRPGGWRGPYSDKDLFHEPFVLFGFLAAITRRVELATEVLILPQRQAVLVAKQAAEVDVLSAGRLRLGVGLGWNQVEFIALGEEFHDRGRRVEEQIDLMRRLWAEPVIEFEGQWHHVPKAGLNPLPTRVIPVWMGGSDERAKDRIARLADGWMINVSTEQDAAAAPADMRSRLAVAGRDPERFGLEIRVTIKDDIDAVVRKALEWKDRGVTHLTVNTMGQGRAWPEEHLDAVLRFKEAIG